MNVQDIRDKWDVPDEELREILALLLAELQLEVCRGVHSGHLFLNQVHNYD